MNSVRKAEECLKKGRSKLAYSEIKKLFRKRKYNAGTLIGRNDEVLLEADQKTKR